MHAEYCYNHETQHKAIIALNNAAVALLVRRHYSEAVDTLRDAIYLAEMPVSSFHAAASGAATAQRQCIAQVLHRSQERSARCCLVKEAKKRASNSSFPPLQVVSSQASPSTIYKALTSVVDCASLDVAFPVTIDVLPRGDHDHNDHNVPSLPCTDICLHIGIVWSNLGIAHLCLKHVHCHVYHDVMLTEAHRIFLQAKRWLGQCDRFGWDQTPISLAFQLLSVRTILTHSLVNIAGQLSGTLDGECYDEYCRDISNLLHSIEEQELFLPMNDHLLASAA